ncbi:ABC transporter permease [Weissella minor]|uniref:ABC transporter permease n=1 Tax=Weissella minor TaxID=1620 RepID=UPI001BB0B29E|nr:ABC transporter permease [Weissella minor]MBS0949052.1 ABC transporter permease [Weissella minor]
MKNMLNLNIWREIKASKARFFSVLGLIALAVFVFVGLKSTPEDMRNTVREAYTEQNLADAKLSMPTNDGFTNDEKDKIKQQKDVDKVEYSYQTDAKIHGHKQALRLISTPDTLSTMEIRSGKMPTQANEIVLGEQLSDNYKIGDTIKLTDNNDKQLDTLAGEEFKVTGFVRSAQFMRRHNLGSTKMATGQLDGFAVTSPDAFTGSENVAQLSYNNVHGAAYSNEYEHQVRENTDNMQKVVNGLAKDRRADLKNDIDKQVKDAQAQKQELETTVQAAQGTPMASQAQAGLDEINEKIDEANASKASIDQLEYTAETRHGFSPGYTEFGGDSDRVGELSNSFPIFFFAVALMVSFVTMQRMADVKRTEVGTLRALGYSGAQSLKEFIVYSVLVATLGTIVGTAIGIFILPQRIFEAFGSNFYTNSVSIGVMWWPILVSYGLALLSTVFPAVHTTYRDMREQAATQMLPKPPANGTRILLERWTGLWSKLSFFNKVTLRNILRNKVRMWMTILGVAGSIALLITGFGIRDSLNKLVPLQYEQIVHYDVIGLYNANASDAERDDYHQAIDEDKNVKRSTDIHMDSMNVSVKGQQSDSQVQLMVPEDNKQFDKYLTLRDYKTGQALDLQDDSAVVTEKLAKLKGLEVGDKLTVSNTKGEEHQVKIGAIAEMYTGHNVVMNAAYYEKVFDEKPDANASLIRLDDRSNSAMRDMAEKLNQEDAAVSALQSGSIRNDIDTVLTSLNQVVLIIIIAAGLLAFTVLFTLTNINVSERIKELSTLKVLGFYPKEVLGYIYRETASLTAVGILIGFGFGYVVHAYLMSVVMPENTMSVPGVTLINLGISTSIIVLFALIVMWLMARKINRVDMLGALK